MGEAKKEIQKQIDLVDSFRSFGENKDKQSPSNGGDNKVFSINSSTIGKVKYSIDFHDGESKNKDGSDFIGISTAKNKKELNQKIKEYKDKGYKMVNDTFQHLHKK
jgi:hypothetical protein